jgi:hypothetical protein
MYRNKECEGIDQESLEDLFVFRELLCSKLKFLLIFGSFISNFQLSEIILTEELTSLA